MKVWVIYKLISIDEFEFVKVVDSEEKAKRATELVDAVVRYPAVSYGYEEFIVE